MVSFKHQNKVDFHCPYKTLNFKIKITFKDLISIIYIVTYITEEYEKQMKNAPSQRAVDFSIHDMYNHRNS